MTTFEQVLASPAARRGRRSWLRWGLAVFAGFETVHLVGGTLGNDWEGWGTFFENLAFIVVTGLVLVGLTYGILVRWGLGDSTRGRNRPALAALAAGLLSLASYPLFFTWAPFLIAPAALVLGRAGLRAAQEGRGRRNHALAGVLAGTATLAIGAGLITYALLLDGNYPGIFGG